MVIAADYPFLDILGTMFVFFLWAAWFWMLITVFADLFRRHDLSGWAKAAWSFFVIVLPFLGVFVYLIAQGGHMAERSAAEAQARRAEFDDYVRKVSPNGGATDQIANAKKLLDEGAIDRTEYEQIKRKALA
jgi:predicted PurR-regulated permease PerM